MEFIGREIKTIEIVKEIYHYENEKECDEHEIKMLAQGYEITDGEYSYKDNIYWNIYKKEVQLDFKNEYK